MSDSQVEAPAQPAPESNFSSGALASDSKPQLPDSSVLGDRLEQIVTADPVNQRRSQESTYDELKNEMAALRQAVGGQFTEQYANISDKASAADDGQSQLMKTIQAELEQIKQGKDELAQRMEQQKLETEMGQFQRDVASWVKSNPEHFPLINEIGEPALVAQKMLEYRQTTGQTISEARAAREVEQQLAGIVDRLAPRLGYTKGDVKPPDSDDSVTINSGMSINEPVDLNSLSEADKIKYLIRKHTQ